jgi:hypothetical protein
LKDCYLTDCLSSKTIRRDAQIRENVFDEGLGQVVVADVGVVVAGGGAAVVVVSLSVLRYQINISCIKCFLMKF